MAVCFWPFSMRALSEKDEDLYRLKVDKMWVEPLAISF